MRICIMCGQRKELPDFTPRGRGFMRACRTCMAGTIQYPTREAANLARRITHKEWNRSHRNAR